MRKITPLFFSGKRTILLSLSFVTLTIAAGFVIISANEQLAELLNNHIMSQNSSGFLRELAIVVSLFIIVFSVRLLNEFIFQTVQWKGSERLKEFFADKLLKVDSKYYYDKQAPQIWSAVNMSSQGVASFYSSILQVTAACIMVLFYGFVVFYIDFYAGLITIATTPVYLLLTRFVGRNFEKIQRDLMPQQQELALNAQEMISNSSNVRAKNAHRFFVERIMKPQKLITRGMRKTNVMYSYLTSVTSMLGIITPLIILYITIQVSRELTLDVGNILILYINIPLFLSNFTTIYSQVIHYRANKPALKILTDIYDFPDENSGEIIMSSFESIQTKGVSVNFQEARIINVPDMMITKGEKVMFLGETGVGKSTLFNILLGFNQEYSGVVLVNGVDIRSYDVSSLRKYIGISFQSQNVVTLSLRDNILLGDESIGIDLDKVLEISHLNDVATARGEDLLNYQTISGGEKSRIGLAQMLVRNPDVFLIDETFSNVDEDTEMMIIEKLLALFSHKTFVCISHRMASAKYFDRVVEF